jgi:hypothetical protein
MGTTLGVAQQADLNVSIPKVQNGLGTVRCETSKLQEKSEFNAMAAMPEFLLGSTDGCLYYLC